LIEAEQGGDLFGLLCRIGDRYRVLDVAVRPIELDGERMKSVRICEATGAGVMAAALEDVRFALLVIGPDGRVQFANRPFLELFPWAVAGETAAVALGRRHGLPPTWWEIAPRQRAQVRFDAAGGAYIAALLSSGREPSAALTVVHLQREAGDAS
jgi:hypothetical protein